MDSLEKTTATHGGDILPDRIEHGDNLEDQDTQLEVYVPTSPSNSNKDKSVLKLDYVNPGLDTTGLYSPRDTGVVTQSKGKLKLDNDVLPLDDSIDTFVRPKKKPYKEIKYKNNYKPGESRNGTFVNKPRRSDRLKGGTTFGPSKTTNAMFVNERGMTVLPSSI